MPGHASALSKPPLTKPHKPPHRFLTLLIMELVLILSYPFTLEIGARFDFFGCWWSWSSWPLSTLRWGGGE